jgi:hypothetical protein
MDNSVVMPFAKHFPDRTKQVEGFMKTLGLPTHTRTHTRTRTHMRDSQGWQHCVVIPLAKHLAGTTGKVEKAKECVVCRQRTEGGRT